MLERTMADTPKLPMQLPGGVLMPHLSARRRHEVLDTVFEMLGGPERLHSEANRDRDGYWEFMKMWAKGLPRAVATEHSVNNESMDELLKKIEARERRGEDILDITPTDVEDQEG